MVMQQSPMEKLENQLIFVMNHIQELTNREDKWDIKDMADLERYTQTQENITQAMLNMKRLPDRVKAHDE